MSKKQFDHIEDRIREAAAASEPPFDANAWADMETRLNKDNRKRRFLFWWLAAGVLFIAIGTAVYMYNKKPNPGGIAQVQKNKTIQQQPANVTATENVPMGDGQKNDRNAHLPQQKNNEVNNISPVKPNDAVKDIVSLNTSQHKIKNVLKNITAGSKTTAAITKDKNRKLVSVKKSTLSSKIIAGATGIEVDTSAADVVSVITGVSAENNNDPVAVNKNKTSVTPADSSTVKDTAKNSIAKIKTTGKNKPAAKSGPLSRFYFSASAGGEIGSVHLLSFNNNPVTALYGGGVGYQLSRKISVQTGFYAGTKKYIAGPGDYNPKAGSYWSMVQIVKVNAACLVYDIPVTVRYNFLQKNGIKYFATAGLSSYIMKKEDYYYYFIRYNMPLQGGYSYTGNKNAFSVFNFSAGIEKKLSARFSLLAEPVLSIPLSGVGDGRVKLYNAALQISLKYQPFKKH